jgi:subtilisin family serine protease
MRVSSNLAKSILLLTIVTKSIAADSYDTKIVKLSSPLSEKEKEALYERGVESIVYAGDLSYYIYGDWDRVSGYINSLETLKGIDKVLSKGRIDRNRDSRGELLENFSSINYVDLNILLLKEMQKGEIEDYLSQNGIDATVYNVSPSIKSAKMRVIGDDIKKLQKLPLIQYIDRSHTLGVRDAKMSRNSRTADYSNVEDVWKAGYGLSGEGFKVAVVDGGYVRKTHQEFKERVINHGSGYADHATHVAGTIGAAGVNERARGMANRVTIHSYSFESSAFADKVLAIYREEGILFSNHSYGYSEMNALGVYDSEAAKQDRAVYANPYLNIFEAAGNDGANENYPQYGKIKGPANSKNILTIGALNLNASAKATFSSNGPAKDGRIKPELVVRGEGIYSTGSKSDSDYFWMNGTSMATPAATGSGILLSEAFANVTGGYDIRHDILKSVLINTAIDKGREGPDYDTGFGMIDLKRAVDTINSLKSSKPLIFVDSISNAKEKRYPFTLQNSGEFKATISWIDPDGNPLANRALVNDIDIYLEDSSGERYYPFTLNPLKPKELARQDRANHIDNIEQIRVKNLKSGDYHLVIKGSVIVTPYQDFAVASNISITNDSNIDTVSPSKLQNFATVIKNSIY